MDPLPPGNRDKLHFSRGELINTLWPFKFKSTTLLKDIENFHNVRLQERLQIVWKQKHKSEHGTWDKKILTPPPIKICPLFDEPKKGDFFTPLPPIWTNVSFSAIFFLEGIPNQIISYNTTLNCFSVIRRILTFLCIFRWLLLKNVWNMPDYICVDV